MNRAKRYAARQIIHAMNVMLYTIEHELWRVINVEADGLNPSEWRQAERIHADLKSVSNRLSELGNRIQSFEPPN